MTFIGQFPVPSAHPRTAYLFMTEDDSGNAPTWEPEAGENAVVIQPTGRVPDAVRTVQAATGPTLWTRGSTWDEQIPVELHVDLAPMDPAADHFLDAKGAAGAAARHGIYVELKEDDPGAPRSYVGGTPVFWRPHLPPVSGPWRFFLQLDGAEGWDDEPYALNLGGGTGFLFLAPGWRAGSRGTASEPVRTSAAQDHAGPRRTERRRRPLQCAPCPGSSARPLPLPPSTSTLRPPPHG